MTPYETAVKITEGYGLREILRSFLVDDITTAIQAASNEQLARSRDGHLADVREFFEKFNVPIAERPAFPDQATLDLRAKLIAERPAVWDLVIADMAERDRTGERKYGTRLQPNNGRDAPMDAYQEALDLCVYLRQAIAERDLDL